MSVQAETKIKATSPRPEPSQEYVDANSWAIRPCFLYKSEYDDCKSFRGRFHQYFIHGESIDCLQWKRDYDNCSRFEENQDLKSAQELIESEADRRRTRLKAHFDNDVWTKREAPPNDWEKTLPEWLIKRNHNTLLEISSRQSKGEEVGVIGERTLCTIM